MEERFMCPACGKEQEGDYRTGVNECRQCRRMHCTQCIDEKGLCVPCSAAEKPVAE